MRPRGRHGTVGREAKTSRACLHCSRRFEVTLRQAFGKSPRLFCRRRCKSTYRYLNRICVCGCCAAVGPSHGIAHGLYLCGSCYSVFVSCVRKARYRSAAYAMAEADTAKPDRLTKDLSTYYCLMCEGWHLTSHGFNVTAGPPASLAIPVVAVAATLHGAGIRRTHWHATFEEETDDAEETAEPAE